MLRALILTASYGSGHNRAAAALAVAFARQGVGVTVLDHFREFVHPLFERLSRALYYATLRRAPALWGLAYGLGDRLPSDSPLTLGVNRLGVRPLARFLERTAPDVVVTVHATAALAMSTLRRECHPAAPANHTTVVTDFVTHSQWVTPWIDRYCVAAEEVRHELVARGIPANRVVVTGMPLDASFQREISSAEARRRLSLSEKLPIVLAMGGSLGSLAGLHRVARAMRRTGVPLQALLVAGRDRQALRSLRRLDDGRQFRVYGYVEEIRELMAAADLLITKAGGMTMAEALTAGVPLLLHRSLPGQERHNERFAARAGLAWVARSSRELPGLVERALASPDALADIRARMRSLARPDGAEQIVRVILDRVART